MEFVFLFTMKMNWTEMKRNHKSNCEKSKLSVNKFKTFSYKKNKKISKTYIIKIVLTTFITLKNDKISSEK